MRDDRAVEVESTELLRTLIRNACVNDGSPASGGEARSVDALEDFFAGSGVALERHESPPGRMSLVARIEYPLMFHGHDERVDVDGLRLSAQMWEALCRDFLA